MCLPCRASGRCRASRPNSWSVHRWSRGRAWWPPRRRPAITSWSSSPSQARCSWPVSATLRAPARAPLLVVPPPTEARSQGSPVARLLNGILARIAGDPDRYITTLSRGSARLVDAVLPWAEGGVDLAPVLPGLPAGSDHAIALMTLQCRGPGACPQQPLMSHIGGERSTTIHHLAPGTLRTRRPSTTRLDRAGARPRLDPVAASATTCPCRRNLPGRRRPRGTLGHGRRRRHQAGLSPCVARGARRRLTGGCEAAACRFKSARCLRPGVA